MVRTSHGRRPESNHHEGSGWLSEDFDPSFIWFYSILFLTTNTLAAAIRARDDPSLVAFVVSIYAFLLLLFWCVRAFDRLPYESRARERLKVPIWLLGSALNLMFAQRVTLVVTANAMAWLVWSLAASSCLFTFYFFFMHTEKHTQKLRAYEHEALLPGEI
ncbi:hypothetical protein ACLOJK_017179 [Asimina triloba]